MTAAAEWFDQAPGRAEAAAAMPAALPRLGAPEARAQAAQWWSLDPAELPELTQTAKQLWETPASRELLWYCVHHFNRHDSPQSFQKLPDFSELIGQDDDGMFCLLIALSLVPTVITRYRNEGIDDAVIRDTLLEINCFRQNFGVGHDGRPGIIRGQLYWLLNYRDAKLFRLGRFEYRLGQAKGFSVILRHRAANHTVALAEAGQRFDRHGYIEYDKRPDNLAWTATFKENPDSVSGCPISPHGFAINKSCDFPLDQWRIAVRKDDPVIDLHIPSGGGMSPEVCQQSFNAAAEFFSRRVTGNKAEIIWCSSWIFNTQLEERMPDSNLAAFMRQQYLFPVKSSGDDGMFFVFCQAYDPAKLHLLPRKTSLQKAMTGILEGGESLRSSGMFFLLRDLHDFGNSPYRRDFPSL